MSNASFKGFCVSTKRSILKFDGFLLCVYLCGFFFTFNVIPLAHTGQIIQVSLQPISERRLIFSKHIHSTAEKNQFCLVACVIFGSYIVNTCDAKLFELNTTWHLSWVFVTFHFIYFVSLKNSSSLVVLFFFFFLLHIIDEMFMVLCDS